MTIPMTSSENPPIIESNHWTNASKRLNCWLISMSLEQIWLVSIDFSQRRNILAFGLLFVIHNIKNWWKHELILTYEMAVILQHFCVDLYLCLPQCFESIANALADLITLFFQISPRNMLSNAKDPLVWFTIRLSHKSLPACSFYFHL